MVGKGKVKVKVKVKVKLCEGGKERGEYYAMEYVS